LDTESKSYARLFQESWNELEQEFRRGNVNPQHENDVVCYLYHALAKRFKSKGFPLHLIRTEDTHTIKRQTLRPDLNLNDRLFVEIKMYTLRKYDEGWDRRKDSIRYYVTKLEKYVNYAKLKTSFRVRRPVLGLWFRKRDRMMELPIEALLIPDDLESKLEREKERYKDKATILYGPKNH